MLNGISNIALAICFGTLLTAGYIMEPVLIGSTDRMTANIIASKMFNAVTLVAMISMVVYLLLQFLSHKLKHWFTYLTIGMLVLMFANYFIFLPEISALMNVDKPEGSTLREKYDLMHTLSISSYMITVLGAAVLVFVSKPTNHQKNKDVELNLQKE